MFSARPHSTSCLPLCHDVHSMFYNTIKLINNADKKHVGAYYNRKQN